MTSMSVMIDFHKFKNTFGFGIYLLTVNNWSKKKCTLCDVDTYSISFVQYKEIQRIKITTEIKYGC